MTWREARRLLDRRVIAAVLVGLALLLGYQVYAYQQQHRNAAAVITARVAARKADRATVVIKRLTKVQCANTRLFYDLFNALAEDSGPHFGSPPGRIVPGARERLIDKLYEAERAQAPTLHKQGCHVTVPPRRATP